MFRAALLTFATLAAVPGAASAASTPPPADCPLWAPGAPVEHAIPGTDLVARDPYGGKLARNRLFFDFTVRGPQADLAKVDHVDWALDGAPAGSDAAVPFEWKGQSGSSRKMPAGQHTVTVTVRPKGGGAPATTSFALTATDCQPIGFMGELPRARGTSTYSFQSAVERGGGPDLTGADLTRGENVTVALPRALRGRAIGTLAIAGGKTYTLKGAATALARDGVVVRLAPGSARFLNVRGLPAGTRAIAIKLASGIATLRHPTRAYRVTGTVRAGAAHASLTGGGRYV